MLSTCSGGTVAATQEITRVRHASSYSNAPLEARRNERDMADTEVGSDYERREAKFNRLRGAARELGRAESGMATGLTGGVCLAPI